MVSGQFEKGQELMIQIELGNNDKYALIEELYRRHDTQQLEIASQQKMIGSQQQEIKKLNKKNKQLENNLVRIQKSPTYRIYRRITHAPHQILKGLRQLRTHDL